jgi:hypothetical protein
MENNRHPLLIQPGWMNAAGSLGFAPPANWPLPVPPVVFVTNPVSYNPRWPAEDRGTFPYPGGFLLHTGWPSPGFRKILQEFQSRWGRSPIPVWVHLLGDTPTHVETMIRTLEEVEGVEAIEISFTHQAENNEILELINGAIGELPLVMSVPIDLICAAWLKPAVDMGISAISLAPPRGLITREGKKLIHGRLYGPSILPQVKAATQSLLQIELPIIAGGGVMRQAEMDALFQIGAAAVQLDFVLWRGWQVEGSN